MDFSLQEDGWPICVSVHHETTPLKQERDVAMWFCPRCHDVISDLFITRAQVRLKEAMSR